MIVLDCTLLACIMYPEDLTLRYTPSMFTSIPTHILPITLWSMVLSMLPIGPNGALPACSSYSLKYTSMCPVMYITKYTLKYCSNRTQWHTQSQLNNCSQCTLRYINVRCEEDIREYAPVCFPVCLFVWYQLHLKVYSPPTWLYSCK